MRGKFEEVLHVDAPEPSGKHVVTIICYDSNLHHNVIAGRLVTTILNFVRKKLHNGTQRSKLQLRLLLMDHNDRLLEHAWSKSLICEQP